ncbi:MAG TPA: isoprenylcysteine carboxylmethyltransferase family protein [Candidatus Polarisedimenticolia bacterium]|jgi:protein-S-isoprenylcysteine O-methyltransferase Ste14
MPEPMDWGFRRRGTFARVSLIPLLLLVLLSRPTIEAGSMADMWTNTLALLAALAGVGLRLWATLYLGNRKGRLVVNEGPYSVCRNPLYHGSLLMAVSGCLCLKSVTLALGAVLTVSAYMLVTVPSEEAFLRERLGEPYLSYCRTVPRYWPRFSLFRTRPVIEIDLHALKLEVRRCLMFLVLPLAAEGIGHVRMQPWWPHLFRLP